MLAANQSRNTAKTTEQSTHTTVKKSVAQKQIAQKPAPSKKPVAVKPTHQSVKKLATTTVAKVPTASLAPVSRLGASSPITTPDAALLYVCQNFQTLMTKPVTDTEAKQLASIYASQCPLVLSSVGNVPAQDTDILTDTVAGNRHTLK